MSKPAPCGPACDYPKAWQVIVSETTAVSPTSSSTRWTAVSCIVPAAILATAPATAPVPSLAPLSIGWVVQGNYLGQVLGPLLIGAVVGAAGWSASILLMLAVAVVGVALGLSFDRLDSSRDRVS